MPAYYHYRRIEILSFNEKSQYKGSFIFNRSDLTELRNDLLGEVQDWAVSEGKKCCLVFGPKDCFFIERNSVTRWSSNVPCSWLGAFDEI